MAPGPDGGAGQLVGTIQGAPACDPVARAIARRAASAMDCLARTHAILSRSADLVTHTKDAIARSQALLNQTVPEPWDARDVCAATAAAERMAGRRRARAPRQAPAP
jgi:hypothetical protein